MQEITIVGGGLVGSCLAVGLADKQRSISVIERRLDPRKGNIERGRSINLAISARGLYALSRIGMEKRVLELAIPMCGRMVHAIDGTTQLQRYGFTDKDAINSISRADLNLCLLEAAERKGVELRFGERVATSAPYRYVIGADGSASALRAELEKLGKLHSQEVTLSHGYKELTLPARNGQWVMEKNVLHIWPRKNFMLIALPNLDGSFTCTLFLANSGVQSFETLQDPAEVERFFSSEFPDFVKWAPNYLADFSQNPTGKMVTIKCDRWGDERTLLIGDAAHAIVPFFGQGMNCGFEDCVAVWEAIVSQPLEQLSEKITQERRVNADAIADMAVENFVEMRDKVSEPEFLKKKALETWLHEKFPDYRNRYQLVSFSRVPYSVAREVGAIQDGILTKLSVNQSETLARELLERELFPVLSRYHKFL